MSKLIITSEYGTTHYSTKVDDRTLICATEYLGELTKYYYSLKDPRKGVPITFYAMGAIDMLGADSLNGIILAYDRYEPHLTKDMETMKAWLDKNSDQISEFYDHLFEDSTFTQLAAATKVGDLKRSAFWSNVISRERMQLTRMGEIAKATATQNHLEEATRHIEQEEYVADIYPLNHPELSRVCTEMKDYINNMDKVELNGN